MQSGGGGWFTARHEGINPRYPLLQKYFLYISQIIEYQNN